MTPMIRRFAGLALVLGALMTSVAQADYNYSLSGTFGADLSSLPTGLAGGTFSGFYTAPSLTNSTSLTSFSDYQVNLFNASGRLVESFAFDTSGTDPFRFGYFDPMVSGRNLGILVLSQDVGADQHILQLEFATPFSGTGSAIPYSPSQTHLSVFAYRNHIVSVVSASSSIPTPPSVVLLGLAGLLGLGRSARGRFQLIDA